MVNKKEAVIDVAIDNGYADQKICYWGEDGKSIVCQSLPSRAEIGAINMNTKGEFVGVYDIDGESWTVSSDVANPERITDKRYAHSTLNAVLVNHSLLAAGMSGKEVRLITGLPFNQYFSPEGIDRAFLDKVKNSLKVPVKPRSGETPANIAAHEITPESTAAWVDFAMDAEGNTNVENFSGAAVVDIGGVTTDVTYINANNTINRQKSGTKRLGVIDVRDKLREELMKKFNIQNLKESELESALRTGGYTLYGKIEDVAEEVTIAKKAVLAKLDNFIHEMVGDASELNYVIFVGGGAAVLSSVITGYTNAHVPDEPVFANARGMLKYARYLFE